MSPQPMASGRTTALFEPSPAPIPLAAASTIATKTAAKVATFVQSTRGAVSSAVAIGRCYGDSGSGPPASRLMLRPAAEDHERLRQQPFAVDDDRRRREQQLELPAGQEVDGVDPLQRLAIGAAAWPAVPPHDDGCLQAAGQQEVERQDEVGLDQEPPVGGLEEVPRAPARHVGKGPNGVSAPDVLD